MVAEEWVLGGLLPELIWGLLVYFPLQRGCSGWPPVGMLGSECGGCWCCMGVPFSEGDRCHSIRRTLLRDLGDSLSGM